MQINIKKHFKPNEMPSIWGSPAKPELPSHIRVLYGVAFAVVLLTAGLQNNLIIAYIDYLQGDMGFTPTQGVRQISQKNICLWRGLLPKF